MCSDEVTIVPHYVFETDENGNIVRTLKDGQPHNQAVHLEQVYSVVTVYFRLASEHLGQMASLQDRSARRCAGLQSFLMGLTGLEAFTNTFFHLRAQELGSEEMLARIAQTHGSLSRKISDLVAMAPDGQMVDQEALLDRIFELSQLRNEIMHPRWTPSALTIAEAVPVTIMGLVENRQAMFEDETLCQEALLWNLLAVARIGQVRGHHDLSGFMFYWTGNYGLTLDMIASQLGNP